MPPLIRLNKFLSQAGVCSRREADRYLKEGRISVNGKMVDTLGVRINPEKDKVKVDGKKINYIPQKIYIVLNKPQGYLVTLKDQFGRPTVFSFLVGIKERIFPVGRLDRDSRGLLLLTNDGELAAKLSHPRYEVDKVYLVKTKGIPKEKDLERIRKGVLLNGKKTAPAEIKRMSQSGNRALFRVVIHEGRKREIRRLFQIIGVEVVDLQRIQFGPLSLGNLREGEWRKLEPKEIRKLKAIGVNSPKRPPFP